MGVTKAMEENWYILFVQSERQSRICDILCEEGVNAFLPMMEYYRRDMKGITRKPMFPGYIFVRTELVQKEFDNLVEALRGRCWGFIKQLKDAGAAAMRAEEIEFFRFLLDESGLARMSYGYLRKQENGRDKAVITEGPLQYFEDRIVKVDRHNRCAWMDFAFMGRKVQAGLTIENAPGKPVCPKEAVCGEGGSVVLADGFELNIEELKSKMNQL
ncbi:hypothetical protein OCV99_09380 [Dorea acetigenes]|jgi:transcriptional antiterminator NusG|uniref:NusG-like N-terminal domain-containing protein n=1 Tax=Dorea acetigenes TaxID=2981787 RepID=A0ABT2RN81_9FIRM|nr:transcription termination/antitermination NusG family protein [Dorea acetigenes]MCU6686751.1 hypothetical protein [Dorea acetigenes]SCJ09412.1 transcriptional activator RfaH [uncultured Clostridium sp.]